SPEHFVKEALEMGVSKRIPFIPKELKLDETVVLLAHKKAIIRQLTEEEMDKQGYQLPNWQYSIGNGNLSQAIAIPVPQR
ncbi:unnamed protein product, partial [marine sediment metagenome]